MYDITTQSRFNSSIYHHTYLSDEVFNSPSYQEEFTALKTGEYSSKFISVKHIPDFDVCPTCGHKSKRTEVVQ